MSLIVPTVVGLVSNLVSFISRKLNDGNMMLLGRIANAGILCGNIIDERIGRFLQCHYPLGVVSAPHRAIHRARRIKHQHNIKRGGCRGLQVRRGRDGRKRCKERRIALRYRLLSTGAGKRDIARLHGFIGPDTSDIFRRVLQAPVTPGRCSVAVGDRFRIARRSARCVVGISQRAAPAGKGERSQQHQHRSYSLHWNPLS